MSYPSCGESPIIGGMKIVSHWHLLLRQLSILQFVLSLAYRKDCKPSEDEANGESNNMTQEILIRIGSTIL